MKDPLDKIFMGKIQSKWFKKGRESVLKELRHYLKIKRYPARHPLREIISNKLDALQKDGE